MEAIKVILIKLVFCTVVFSQEYSISIFGFHAADVTLKRDSTSNEFETNNRGLFDLIWPASNNYKTVFDKNNYSIKNWEKIIKQGSYKVKMSGSVTSDGYMEYDDEKKTFVEPYLPNYKIGIIHLAAGIWSNNKDMRVDKKIKVNIKSLEGKILEKSLRNIIK